jgi:predicted RNase H-like nuclease
MNCRARKRNKLNIGFCKIAVKKFGKIKKTHSGFNPGKFTINKVGLFKIAAIKMMIGKIDIFKTHT